MSGGFPDSGNSTDPFNAFLADNFLGLMNDQQQRTQQDQQQQHPQNSYRTASTTANSNGDSSYVYNPSSYPGGGTTNSHHQLLMPHMTLTTTTINHLTLSPPPTQFATAPAASNTSKYMQSFSLPAAGAPYDRSFQQHEFLQGETTASSSQQNEIDPLLLMSETIFSNNNIMERMTPPPILSSSSMQQQEKDDDSFLDDIQLTVSSLSLEPLSGRQVLDRVHQATRHVLTRYIPCADFLVQCQQDLRKGLHYRTSAHQYYKLHVEPAPHTFGLRNEGLMDATALQDAMQGLQTLVQDAARQRTAEQVKNVFLGGMKDGESWGLRKWLSRHGGALMTCTNLEEILGACKKLDKQLATTKQVAALLRPCAKKALDRLKKDIPPSYQEVSAAHPYLPFFHRLEGALRAMSQFDPDEDPVICIDDSDDDDDVVEVVQSAPVPPRKRRKVSRVDMTTKHLKAPPPRDDDSSSGESQPNVVVQVVDTQQQQRQQQVAIPWPLATTDHSTAQASADAMAKNLLQVATFFDEHQQNLIRPAHAYRTTVATGFWDGPRYASALKLFGRVLCSAPEYFLEAPPEGHLLQLGATTPYSHVVKNPLCFRDIVAALILNEDEATPVPFANNGRLSSSGNLSKWNMWSGTDLLQAIDLVLLNSLAYGKVLTGGNSRKRTAANKLRKMLWDGIEQIVPLDDADLRRKCTPCKRSATSGFVVYKIKESRR